MTYVPLAPPPGLFKNGTRYQAKGRWWNASGIRFRGGAIRPIGGWDPLGTFHASEVVRSLLTWIDNSGAAHLLEGTNDKVFHFLQGTSTDVTPVGLTPGTVDSSYGTGAYGTGNYGTGPYGVGSSGIATLTECASWSFETWGEDALGVMTADGKLWWYDTSVGTAMTQPSGSPTGNRALVVTPERFCVLLGAGGDPRLVQWADQQSLTVWTPTAANQAGQFELPGNGVLMCGRRGVGETLLWTSVDLFAMQYIAGTLVYSFTPRGQGCGVTSRNAVAMLGGQAAWMGRDGFYLYDGTVRPLPCSIRDDVFGNFNRDEAAKVWAVAFADFGEVWWGYPSASSQEPDTIAVWSYLENHWTRHDLERSCAADRGAFGAPVMIYQNQFELIGDVGYRGSLAYLHETGSSRDGLNPLGTGAPYLESGPFEMGDGEQVGTVSQLIPDEATTAGQQLGSLEATLYTTLYPTAAEVATGPFALANPTTVRLPQARQARLRLDEVVAGDWAYGTVRLDVVPGGHR